MGSTTLIEVVTEMVDASPVPKKAIATNLGWPYSTMCRELNPFDDGAKLGADRLVPLMRECGSIAPLEFIAATMGYALRRIGDSRPDGHDMAEECAQGFEAVARFLTAARCGRHDYVTLLRFYELASKEMEDVVVRARSEQAGRGPVELRKAG